MGVCRAILSPDTDYAKDIIRSVYFDTADYRCAQRSLDGELNRMKFRYRGYGNERNGYLEIKYRFSRLTGKIRESYSVDNIGDLEMRAETFSSLLKDVPIQSDLSVFEISPSYYITYCRERFFYPNCSLRVSLDVDVRASKLPRDWWSGIDIGNLQALPMSVLEIKFDASDRLASEIGSTLVSLTGKKNQSFSKYALSHLLYQGDL